MTEPVADASSTLHLVLIDDNRARSLGDRLRQVFDEVVDEPLPDAFADLLRRLD